MSSSVCIVLMCWKLDPPFAVRMTVRVCPVHSCMLNIDFLCQHSHPQKGECQPLSVSSPNEFSSVGNHEFHEATVLALHAIKCNCWEFPYFVNDSTVLILLRITSLCRLLGCQEIRIDHSILHLATMATEEGRSEYLCYWPDTTTRFSGWQEWRGAGVGSSGSSI